MSERRNWTHEERLAAFYVYATEPFGRIHKGNALVIDIADRIGRSPSALAMKALNFASFDPVHKIRGVRGLGNASQADREFWEDFTNDSAGIAAAAEAVVGESNVEFDMDLPVYSGNTDEQRLVKVRRAQGFFRKAVLASYEGRCALSGIAIPELLNASHIVPWRDNSSARADPRNGIALNALYDRAFDRGLFTLNDQFQVVVSPCVPKGMELMDIGGRRLKLPSRWRPLLEYVRYHRAHIFREND